MIRHAEFPGVCACGIPHCLELMLQASEKRTVARRPSTMKLEVRILDDASSPIFVPVDDNKIAAVVDKEPVLSDPNGGMLLWIRYTPPNVCDGTCDGHCAAMADIDVWQSERFPLTRLEVDWFLATELHCPEHEWAQLPRSWHLMQRACEKTGEVTFHPEPYVAACSPAMVRRTAWRRSRGAPLLSATRWLQAEIAKLGDPHGYSHLYDGWIERYREQTGRRPGCPERSFRQAAEGCIARLTPK